MARMKIFITKKVANLTRRLPQPVDASWVQTFMQVDTISSQELGSAKGYIRRYQRPKKNWGWMSQKVLQFCVTQCHMGQGAIAKNSSFLSQHETPPQLSNWTGRSWSCVHITILAPFEWTEALPWWETGRAHLLQAIQPWKYQHQRCNEKVPLIISKIFFKPYQCAVGFCLHHISEAEPVKFYHHTF